MRKRRIIVLAMAVVAVLGGVIWWAVATRPPAVPDPVYDGHSLSYWMGGPDTLWAMFNGRGGIVVSFTPSYSRSHGGVPTREIVEPVDTNALPFLVNALKRGDGFYARVWTFLPSPLQEHLPFPEFSDRLKINSLEFLRALGTRGRPAIPEVIRLLRGDHVDDVRFNSAEALAAIATSDDESAIEALITAAKRDRVEFVRAAASDALNSIDPAAAIKAGVTNAPLPHPWVRTNSVGGVHR